MRKDLCYVVDDDPLNHGGLPHGVAHVIIIVSTLSLFFSSLGIETGDRGI